MDLRLELIVAGSCTHPAWVVTGRPSLEILRFPSLVGVIHHPSRGLILFDAGYSPRFFDETRRLPGSIYRRLTPTTCGEEDTVAAQLRRAGRDPDDVALVILSHFHADHVGGLLDFPAPVSSTAAPLSNAIFGGSRPGATSPRECCPDCSRRTWRDVRNSSRTSRSCRCRAPTRRSPKGTTCSATGRCWASIWRGMPAARWACCSPAPRGRRSF